MKKRISTKGRNITFALPDVEKCDKIKALRDNIKFVMGFSGRLSAADCEMNYEILSEALDDYKIKIRKK